MEVRALIRKITHRLFFFVMSILLPISALSETVVIPEGTTSIESEAFSGCTAVTRVQIPTSVETIGDDAFSDCGEALWILTEPGNAAVDYARANQIDYFADTHYRALLICQTYPGTSRELEGPATDKQAMNGCLSNLDETPFVVSSYSNLSADEIVSVINTTFSAANEYDVSLFYYSGHGDSDGSLVGADKSFSTLSPSALRKTLDTIPGRKIVIVDACYSGTLIDEESTSLLQSRSLTGPGTFVSSFQSAFRTRLRGALNADQYFVITAAQANEESMEALVGNKAIGLFTYGFCLACGWDGVNNARCNLAGDTNSDDAVSIQEAYAYASQIPMKYNAEQSAAVWPANCRWFAPLRR